MEIEREYPEEVLVRDVKLDEPFFLTPEEAKREEMLGNVVIIKNERPKEN